MEEKKNIEINKNYLLIGMAMLIVIALVLVFFQAFEMKKLTNQLASKTITLGAGNSAGSVDMTGWTDQEKMMYQHHGVLPSRITGNAVSNNPSGMVGGC